ncbi:hypothetical protein Q5P01_021900 [Channa striata]|uniref:Uncharacterized protein n=1 Tax=Channa striata TaxID=64152 RepID=A0AA88LUZ6_CHASR|nr:hypothetical protein Q5P01_021900 [Channa striata]
MDEWSSTIRGFGVGQETNSNCQSAKRREGSKGTVKGAGFTTETPKSLMMDIWRDHPGRDPSAPGGAPSPTAAGCPAIALRKEAVVWNRHAELTSLYLFTVRERQGAGDRRMFRGPCS